jgi:hypothetical protein
VGPNDYGAQAVAEELLSNREYDTLDADMPFSYDNDELGNGKKKRKLA